MTFRIGNKRNIFKIRTMRNGALTWSDEKVPAIMSQPVLCVCLIKESDTLLILIPNHIWFRVASITYSLYILVPINVTF